ncbi:membrane protein insertase YidC [Mycoplasmopsis verecunda]|uniref:YidC/Oxa1 family membrane protein insertase n=1 Tax=Mycoplasmopsis verecunda TaxID=171291 RepID=A0A1T4LQ39_9BACT|nr:membrane protein insertase YidC [Mycoplasmopsis verecunda]WPB54549.1 membrane protein insertase YidC [Mycoplasmopsis verecunda]SJZ56849.1 YidC/Oxa1 family membrane protein insertase [Mycoplasmopsis verecunda]
MKKSKNNNFQYFTNSVDPKEKRKQTFKTFLKWFKIVFYVFVFGLTITGCVQAFALRNSYNVGNGIEFYTNENDIAPRVNTLKNKNDKIEYVTSENSENQAKSTYQLNTLTVDQDGNFYLRNQEVLSQLRKQTKENDGNYGVSNNYMVAFQLPQSSSLSQAGLVTDKDSILGTESNDIKNIRYLFRSGNATQYQYVTDAKNNPIYVFAFDYEFNKEKNNDGSYVKLGSVLTNGPSRPFLQKATQQVTIKDENGKEITKTIPIKDVNGNIPIVDITGVQMINTPDNMEVTITNPETKTTNRDLVVYNANRMFARDVLQVFYEYSFGKDSAFAKELGATPSEFIKNLIDNMSTTNKENQVSDGQSPIFTLTPKQYAMLEQYQTTMSNYMNELAYFNRDNKDNNLDRWLKEASKSKAANKYNYNENILYSQNAETVVFSGDYKLEPITNWGYAWQYGPFYGLLVYPLSVLIQSLRQAMPSWDGWASIIAILIAIILTRLIGLAITFKSTVMQQVMEELKHKKAAIEAKYKGLETNKAMKMRKQQELQALYAKYNINPADQFGTLILSMPLFFAMWRVIQSIPEIKETTWLGVNFASISYKRLFDGQWVYLWVLAAVIIFQILSMMLPRLLNKKKFKRRTTIAEAEALKKSERTQKIMMIVFTVITVMFSAGVQVYWIFGSIWTILQTLVIHYLTQSQWFKQKYLNKKLMRN